MSTEFDYLILYSLSYCGTPSQWGGDSYSGIDCSGLIVNILRAGGLLKKGEDYSAKGLFEKFRAHSQPLLAKPDFTRGNLLFFGASFEEISHVAFLLGPNLMVEANGSKPDLHTAELARRAGAYVRVSHVTSRQDKLAVVKTPWVWAKS